MRGGSQTIWRRVADTKGLHSRRSVTCDSVIYWYVAESKDGKDKFESVLSLSHYNKVDLRWKCIHFDPRQYINNSIVHTCLMSVMN